MSQTCQERPSKQNTSPSVKGCHYTIHEWVSLCHKWPVHNVYKTVCLSEDLLVFSYTIRAVWADDGDRPLLPWRIFGAMAVSRQDLHGKHMAGPYSAFQVRLGSWHVLAMEMLPVSHPQACRSVCQQFYNQPIRCPRGSASASISISYCAQRFSVLYAYGMMARNYFCCLRDLIGWFPSHMLVLWELHRSSNLCWDLLK
jgi:hypothetical protein